VNGLSVHHCCCNTWTVTICFNSNLCVCAYTHFHTGQQTFSISQRDCKWLWIIWRPNLTHNSDQITCQLLAWTWRDKVVRGEELRMHLQAPSTIFRHPQWLRLWMYNTVNVFARGITLPGQMYLGEPISYDVLRTAAIDSVGNLASKLSGHYCTLLHIHWMLSSTNNFIRMK